MRYFCVRIRVRGGANASGALAPLAQQTQKISLPIKKRKGVQGEAAKKLKGIFGLLRHYGLQKVSFKAPFRIEGFSFHFSPSLWRSEALRRAFMPKVWIACTY